MTYDVPLQRGVLLRRRYRFFADVELPDGRVVTAHCPNTGSMLTCSTPGSRAFISESPNPDRRLKYTLELVESNGALVSVHTGRTNRIVEEALEKKLIPALRDAVGWRREVRFWDSRFDFKLDTPRGSTFLEVKNVTLVEDGVAMFPDAVSVRGRKHLSTLMRALGKGHGAAMVYLVPRGDARVFAPADHIDPDYGRTFRRAAQRGVLLLAFRARVTPRGVALDAPLPVLLHRP